MGAEVQFRGAVPGPWAGRGWLGRGLVAGAADLEPAFAPEAAQGLAFALGRVQEARLAQVQRKGHRETPSRSGTEVQDAARLRNPWLPGFQSSGSSLLFVF